MRRLILFSKTCWILLGIFLAGVLGISLYPLPVLLLSSGEQVLTLRIVRPGDTFLLGFLHSIARSDIWDRFTVDAQFRIVLIETRFQGQGTGIPYGAAGGETLIREGNWFRLTGMKRVLPAIDWRVGAEWHNRFRFGNEPEIDLSAKTGDRLVHVRVEKMTAIAWLWTYALKSMF
jgi:hypothetical protein